MVHIALQQPFPHKSFQRLKPLEKLTFRNLWTKDRQSNYVLTRSLQFWRLFCFHEMVGMVTLQYMVIQRSYCASQQIVKFL